MNRQATFINTLTAGDVFYFDGYPQQTNRVVSRTSEPGRTSVTYTIDCLAGTYTFTSVGLATVYTD